MLEKRNNRKIVSENLIPQHFTILELFAGLSHFHEKLFERANEYFLILTTQSKHLIIFT